MFRCQLVLQQRYTVCSHHLISYRYLSQFMNNRHHQIRCNNYISNKSNPLLLSSKDASLINGSFQKRSFVGTPSPQSVNLMLKGLFVYLLLYFSYKFVTKRQDRAPRLEIIENHCFSPFHINTILSLIYPKLLGIFQKHSNIHIPNKYSSKNLQSDKHDIHSLIINSDNNYDIDIHQKIWINQSNVGEKDIKRYNKFLSKSWLHSFNFETETLPLTTHEMVQKWFANLLSHSFTLDDTETRQQTPQTPTNTEENMETPTITLASTLRFDDELKYKFNIVHDSQVPFTEIAYFKKDENGNTFSEYLQSDIHSYKYMEYQEHEIVVIPFKNNDNLSLILSLPILDYDFIFHDKADKKYSKNQKYIKWAIHPHDLHTIFEPDASGNDELLQLYIPRIENEYRSELKDHHIVSVGLNTIWLPLYYSNLCLKSIDCNSYLNIDANRAQFELLSIGHFDTEKRVWAAMRWKYGLRDIALKINWYNFKQKFKWKRKVKNDESVHEEDEEQPYKTIVFDRPFDYYLYDSCTQIVYASGTVSA